MSQRHRIIAALLPLMVSTSSLFVSLSPPGCVPYLGAARAAEPDSPSSTRRKSADIRRKRLRAACQKRAAQIGEQLGESCHVLEASPFVIAGDLTQDRLQSWYDDTIGPAARCMAHAYFRVTPDEPITVLLFDSEESYDHYAQKLYQDQDVSVYGYYKPGIRTLVMNISTGGGTLVHELTHALIDFDFPDVPDWFNEGLASLHEQCRFRSADEGIDGLINWRLPGLQSALHKKRLRTLRSLVEDDDFRATDEGQNYAQARYFCLYMQEQGVLEEFYRRFRDQHADDPFGAEAVLQVFPDRTWNELDADFRGWVMELEPLAAE